MFWGFAKEPDWKRPLVFQQTKQNWLWRSWVLLMFRAESKKMPHTCWFFHEVWEDKKSHVFKVIPCRLLRRKVPSQRQRCDQIPPSSGDNQVPTCHTCLWKSLPSCLCFEMTFKNLPLPKELLLKTTKDFKSGVRICQQSQQTPIFFVFACIYRLIFRKERSKIFLCPLSLSVHGSSNWPSCSPDL